LPRPSTSPKNAKLGKSELKAGEYLLRIEGNKATVQKGKDIVAESEGRWKTAAPSPRTIPC